MAKSTEKKPLVPGKKPLVIVESPAKAKTISKFLGSGYLIEASIGHVRDLPSSADEIPDEHRKEAWSRLGIDVEHDFKPIYVVPPGKRDQIRKLKALLKQAGHLYLATDEDREGESISWHLLQELAPKVPVDRLVFHEITKEAILAALANPRQIDTSLVEAQETRRIVDRLYGYSVSPLLWRKIRPRLSAGRVQSVAIRLIVEREKERLAFHRAGYWDVEGTFRTAPGATFKAGLVSLAGRRIATGKDFDAATGRLEASKELPTHLVEKTARDLVARLRGRPAKVISLEQKPFTERPRAAVHDEHAAAGVREQAPVHRAAHDARRAAALRERLHDLHAHRLDDAVERGAVGGALADQARVRARPTCPRRRGPTRRRSRTRRRPTRRSARRDPRSRTRATSAPRWATTSARSTTWSGSAPSRRR